MGHNKEWRTATHLLHEAVLSESSLSAHPVDISEISLSKLIITTIIKLLLLLLLSPLPLTNQVDPCYLRGSTNTTKVMMAMMMIMMMIQKIFVIILITIME